MLIFVWRYCAGFATLRCHLLYEPDALVVGTQRCCLTRFRLRCRERCWQLLAFAVEILGLVSICSTTFFAVKIRHETMNNLRTTRWQRLCRIMAKTCARLCRLSARKSSLHVSVCVMSSVTSVVRYKCVTDVTLDQTYQAKRIRCRPVPCYRSDLWLAHLPAASNNIFLAYQPQGIARLWWLLRQENIRASEVRCRSQALPSPFHLVRQAQCYSSCRPSACQIRAMWRNLLLFLLLGK